MGQELGFLVWSLLQGYSQDTSWGGSHLIPWWLIHMASKFMLVVESLIPTTVSLFQGCLSVMIQQLAFTRTGNSGEQGRSHNPIYDLASKVTHCHFLLILLVVV